MFSSHKVTLMFFLLLLLTPPVFSQSRQLTQATLPLQFVIGDPPPFLEPTTEITIQGETIPIIVDTGAKKAGVILSEEILKHFNVEFTGQKICLKMIKGQYCQNEFIIPEIKLGAFTIKNVHGVIMPNLFNVLGLDRNKASKAVLNGMIGFPVLSQFNFLLDPHNSRIVLMKPHQKPIQYNFEDWPCVAFEDHFSTKLKIDGQQVTISWDTAAIPSIISQSIAKHFTQTPCPQSFPSENKDCSLIKTKLFSTINNEPFPNTWFKLSEMPSHAPFDGLIGSNFYAENSVYFDMDDHKIYVKPN